MPHCRMGTGLFPHQQSEKRKEGNHSLSLSYGTLKTPTHTHALYLGLLLVHLVLLRLLCQPLCLLTQRLRHLLMQPLGRAI